MSLPRIERLTWVDSSNCSGWIEQEEIIESLDIGLVESVGFVVGETVDCIYLSTTVVDTGCLGVVSIPLVAIVDRKVIVA